MDPNNHRIGVANLAKEKSRVTCWKRVKSIISILKEIFKILESPTWFGASEPYFNIKLAKRHFIYT